MRRLLIITFCLLPAVLLASTVRGNARADVEVDPRSLRDSTADPGLEVLLEGGVAMPLGNLGAGLVHTETGMGAEPGYRLGLRARWITRSGWCVAPTFTEFGDFDGRNDVSGKTGGVDQKFKVKGASIRYGLDVGYLTPGKPSEWRFYVGTGVGLVQQLYSEELVDDELTIEDSLYDLSWLATVGVRHGGMELALEYHTSAFETSRFFQTHADAEYDWSYAAVRFAYALPRF